MISKLEKYKNLVETSKNELVKARTEKELNDKAIEDLMESLKTQYGINSFEELESKLKELDLQLTSSVAEIETQLTSLGITI